MIISTVPVAGTNVYNGGCKISELKKNIENKIKKSPIIEKKFFSLLFNFI